jgi:hypothetical protein
MAFQYSAIPQFFKILFADGLIQPLSQKDSPLRARLQTADVWGGDSVRSVPMRYALPQARSRNAVQAINERFTASSQLAQWVMKAGYDYATFRINYTDILRARKDPMAFARLQQFAVVSTIETLNTSINRTLYRDGTGSIAQVASINSVTPAGTAVTAGTAIGLLSAADAYQFDPGMYLQFFNVVGAQNVPTLLNGGETRQVLSVDPEAGYLYIDQSLSTLPGAAANTFILQAGDGAGYGSTLEDGAIVGIAATLPLTAPQTGDNFWNQDRSFYTVKLAGHRKDARGLILWEEVQRMAARSKRLGARMNALYMAPEQLQNMIIGRDNLTENFRWVKTTSGDDGMGGQITQNIGFDGVKIMTPAGVIECFGDAFCPADRVYALQEDTWHLDTMGEFPHLVRMGNVDGLLQESDNYALQGRLYAAGQLWCDAPGYNGVIQVTPVF